MTLIRANSRLITIIFLILAVACYATGLMLPGLAFFVAGGVAELLFWARVLRRRR